MLFQEWFKEKKEQWKIKIIEENNKKIEKKENQDEKAFFPKIGFWRGSIIKRFFGKKETLANTAPSEIAESKTGGSRYNYWEKIKMWFDSKEKREDRKWIMQHEEDLKHMLQVKDLKNMEYTEEHNNITNDGVKFPMLGEGEQKFKEALGILFEKNGENREENLKIVREDLKIIEDRMKKGEMREFSRNILDEIRKNCKKPYKKQLSNEFLENNFETVRNWYSICYKIDEIMAELPEGMQNEFRKMKEEINVYAKAIELFVQTIALKSGNVFSINRKDINRKRNTVAYLLTSLQEDQLLKAYLQATNTNNKEMMSKKETSSDNNNNELKSNTSELSANKLDKTKDDIANEKSNQSSRNTYLESIARYLEPKEKKKNRKFISEYEKAIERVLNMTDLSARKDTEKDMQAEINRIARYKFSIIKEETEKEFKEAIINKAGDKKALIAEALGEISSAIRRNGIKDFANLRKEIEEQKTITNEMLFQNIQMMEEWCGLFYEGDTIYELLSKDLREKYQGVFIFIKNFRNTFDCYRYAMEEMVKKTIEKSSEIDEDKINEISKLKNQSIEQVEQEAVERNELEKLSKDKSLEYLKTKECKIIWRKETKECYEFRIEAEKKKYVKLINALINIQYSSKKDGIKKEEAKKLFNDEASIEHDVLCQVQQSREIKNCFTGCRKKPEEEIKLIDVVQSLKKMNASVVILLEEASKLKIENCGTTYNNRMEFYKDIIEPIISFYVEFRNAIDTEDICKKEKAMELMQCKIKRLANKYKNNFTFQNYRKIKGMGAEIFNY